MSVIDNFDGDFRFLSNFYPAEVVYEGLRYSTSEAAYQAAKTLDEEERVWFTSLPPNVAKREGRELKLRPDWDEVKDKVMEDIVRDKFSRSKLLTCALLATNDSELVEGNWWGDKYWGVCQGEGMNMLGKILMKVRDELREKHASVPIGT